MNHTSTFSIRALWTITAALAFAFTATYETKAQSPPQSPPGPNPAKTAVEQRQAVYKLLGANFKPIGDVLQGRVQFDATEIQKRATRVAFLAELTPEHFADVSNVGLPSTKAKAEIWNKREDFDRRQQEFVRNAQALAQVVARDKSENDAFKSAAGALAQSCKSCHDNFREK